MKPVSARGWRAQEAQRAQYALEVSKASATWLRIIRLGQLVKTAACMLITTSRIGEPLLKPGYGF